MNIVKKVVNAYAAPTERRKIEELFASLDRNNDKRISRNEFKSTVGNISFEELDSNSDGSLRWIICTPS